MLGTFQKDFISQATTSTSGNFLLNNFPSVNFPSPAALGSPLQRLRGANLTFGKLSLGKLHIWKFTLSHIVIEFIVSFLFILFRVPTGGRDRSKSPAVRGKTQNNRGLSPNVRGLSPNVRGKSPNVRAVSPSVRAVSPSVRSVSPNVRGMSLNVSGVPAKRPTKLLSPTGSRFTKI